MMITTGDSAEEVAKKMKKKVEPTFISYAKTTDASSMSVEGLYKHMKTTNKTFDVATIKSKALTLAMGALNAVTTMGLSLLASWAIGGIISFFDNLYESPKEIAEAAQEAKNNIDELMNMLKNSRKTVEDSAQRFAELSQEVNMLTGENKSLSTEEYEEFLQLSNKLAELFPELNRNYTSNGDAIVQLTGDIDGIVSSLNDLVIAQQNAANQELADEMPKAFKGYISNMNAYKKSISDFNKDIDDTKQKLLDFYSAEKTYNTFDAAGRDKFTSLASDLGIDLNVLHNQDNGAYNNTITYIIPSNEEVNNQVQSIIDNYEKQIAKLQGEIEQENNSIKKYFFAFLSTDWDYANLTTEMQTMTQKIVGSIDWSKVTYKGEVVDSWKDAEGYIKDNILGNLAKLSTETQQAFTKLFSVDPNTMPTGQFIDAYNELIETAIKELKLDEEEALEFRIRFSYVLQDEQEALAKAKSKMGVVTAGGEKEEWLESLLPSDLQLLLTLDIDEDTLLEDAKKILEDAKDKLPKYSFIDTTETIKSFDEIQSAYGTLSSAVDEYNNGKTFSLDTMQALMSLDKQYLGALISENGQLKLNTEAFKQLTLAKIQSLQADEINNIMSRIEALKDEASAVNELKNETLSLTAASWADARTQIATMRFQLQRDESPDNPIDKRMAALDELENEIDINEAAFNAFVNGLGNLGDFFGSGTGSGSQDNVFDWAANSISNLNRELDNLNRKLEDASLEDKVQIYTDLATKNQELVDATEQSSKVYENEWTKKSSGLSSTYKNQIMSGKVFKLEDFSSEEKFKEVTEAQQAYEQWQSMLQTYLDALKQQKTDEEAAIENDIAIAQQGLDLIASADLETLSVKEKVQLLKEEKALKKSIFESNLKLAKSEAERKQLQEDYNNDEKDIAERKYENARDGRNNRIAFRESKIQDIQNKIDLAELQGGQGTEAQYTAMNDHLGVEIDWEQQNYDAAKAMRDTFKYGTDGWEKYNAEMQQAENNINACKKAQIENNRAILELPIKQYEDANKELQKQLDLQNENLAKIESAMSYAQTLIQDEIDALNDDKEAISDSYDERIKKIQEEKDAFTESNDELQRTIDLQNAKFALEKALRNKTVRIYRAGQGFVYEADQEEVRNAQSELDQQVYDNTVADFDKEIQTLTDEKEAKLEVLDDEIELWEDYAEQLEKVSGLYDKLEGQRNFLELFKSSGETAILNKDTGIIGQMGGELFSTKSEIDNLEGQIKANETTIAKIKEEAAGYLTTVEQIDEAQEKINAIILANEDEIEAIGTRTTKVDELKNKWDETETDIDLSLGGIETANAEAKDNESTIFEERENRLRQFRDEVVKLYGDIANAVTQANSSYAELQSTLANATKVANDISDLDNGTTKPKTKVPTYHSGGIVGKPSKSNLPEHLIALTDANLKPNETLAKLLNGEVVLNPPQVDNLFTNISRAFALTPLNKREDSPITVSIGDVNVYNPENTDMIVNEIVKELPLKVVQRLHSK